MARKRMKRKKKGSLKMPMASDTQLVTGLIANDASGVGQGVVDVVEELCKLNHRLYRQAMTYPVSFKATAIPHTSNTISYQFYTLANNWFVHGAIKYGFRNWRASLQEELMGGAAQGKYMDWRVQHTNPDGNNCKLVGTTWDGDGYNTLESGEYNDSTTDIYVEDVGGSVRGFNLFGSLTSNFNIFAEYAKYLDSRRPDTEASVVDTSYSGLNHGDFDGTREDMVEDFDNPPYPHDLSSTNWADAVMVLQDTITIDPPNATAAHSTRTFDAPLGFVFVVKQVNGTATDVSTVEPELMLRVKPGVYKGTGAKPIQRWPGDLRLATARSNR